MTFSDIDSKSHCLKAKKTDQSQSLPTSGSKEEDKDEATVISNVFLTRMSPHHTPPLPAASQPNLIHPPNFFSLEMGTF